MDVKKRKKKDVEPSTGLGGKWAGTMYDVGGRVREGKPPKLGSSVGHGSKTPATGAVDLIESPPGGCTAAPSFVLGSGWQAFVDRLDLGEISAHLARHREVGKWGITTTVPAARIVQKRFYKPGTKVRRVKSFTSLGLLLASFWDPAGVQND